MAKKKAGGKKSKQPLNTEEELELIPESMSVYETTGPPDATSSGQSSFDRLMADDLESPASLRSVPNSGGRSPVGSMRTPSPARSRAYSRDAGLDRSRSRTPSPVPMPPPRMSFIPSKDAQLGGYMKNRRDLLSIIKDLHSTGIQNELDLPQIVVVGSQSVGKSSLIESMSGLSLPRDTGTCTRCPMECRLQQASLWSCKIKLRFQYSALGQPLNDMREVDFGDILYDKRQVGQMLRRAQRAILRPTLNPADFLDDTDLEKDGHPPLTFSKNCVCINVSGPNVPDLYFYDLPGLIANVAEGGDLGDIALVEGLAKDYIKRPNCIVLLVISCETDFENQGAGRLVLGNERIKQRTIGVLTKVDRIEFGAADKWLRILRNERNALLKGWFCVKQPDPLQLEAGITWEDARTIEKEFFQTNSPWSGLDQRHRQRLGSENLADKLGATLSDLVSKELPNIQRMVTQQLAQIEQQLRAIPVQQIADPRNQIVVLLRNFSKTISKHIEGLPPAVKTSTTSNTVKTGLIHALNETYEKFRHKVHQTAPQFRPWSSTTTISTNLMQDLIDSAKEDDDAVGLGQICTLHLDEVADLARRSRTRELPGNYPFSVKANLIQESTECWRALAQECFKKVAEIVVNHVELLIDEYFDQYVHGGLKDAILRVARVKIAESAKYTMDKIEGLCRGEDEPYTQNELYFYAYRSKLVRRYKLIQQQSLGQHQVVTTLRKHTPSINQGTNEWTYINNIINNLSYIGIQGVTAQDLSRLLPDADLEPALEIMAEVRAYFQVAYKRFGDNVPNQIDTGFVRRIDDDLNIALMSMDFSSENCLRWLQEPAAVTRKRKELAGKKRRLESAKNKLSVYYAGQALPVDEEDLPDMPPEPVSPTVRIPRPRTSRDPFTVPAPAAWPGPGPEQEEYY